MKVKHSDFSMIVMLLSIYVFITSVFIFDIDNNSKLSDNPLVNIYQYISPQLFFAVIAIVIILIYGNYMNIKYNLYYLSVAKILVLIFNAIVIFNVLINDAALFLVVSNMKYILLLILLVVFHSEYNLTFVMKTSLIVLLLALPKFIITVLILAI